MAVSFHKLVAERGVWGDDLLRGADIAWSSGTNRGKEMAMVKWWIAAERGSEIAQNNLAFVLDQGACLAGYLNLCMPDRLLFQTRASCV
jgi:SEL1 protein